MKKQWYDEEQTDKRMNVIGQNGNDGEHYGKVIMYSEEDIKAAWNDGSNQYSGIGDAETYFENLKKK